LETGQGIRALPIKILFILCIFVAMGTSQDSDTLNTRAPKKATMTAALIPGGGQVYNGKYLKGAVIFGLESLALYSFYDNNQKYNSWNETYPLRQQRYMEKRNKYAWWAVFIYVYGLLDAMVDAHLMTFDDKMDEDIGVTTYDDTIKVELNEKQVNEDEY
jgi:hypothetical protein